MRVMNERGGKGRVRGSENESSSAHLKEAGGHGSSGHTVIGWHVTHDRAGGGCCTLGEKIQIVSTEMTSCGLTTLYFESFIYWIFIPSCV